MEKQTTSDKIAKIKETRSEITENLKQLTAYARQHEDPTKIKAYRAKVDEGMKLIGKLLMQYSILNAGKLGAATEDMARDALNKAQKKLTESYDKISLESAKTTAKKAGTGFMKVIKRIGDRVNKSGRFHH